MPERRASERRRHDHNEHQLRGLDSSLRRAVAQLRKEFAINHDVGNPGCLAQKPGSGLPPTHNP